MMAVVRRVHQISFFSASPGGRFDSPLVASAVFQAYDPAFEKSDTFLLSGTAVTRNTKCVIMTIIHVVGHLVAYGAACSGQSTATARHSIGSGEHSAAAPIYGQRVHGELQVAQPGRSSSQHSRFFHHSHSRCMACGVC